MRADKRERHQRLCKIIEATIAEAVAQGEECDFEGQQWAIRQLSSPTTDTRSSMPRGPPMPTRRPKIDPSGSMIALTCSPMTLRPNAFQRDRKRVAGGTRGSERVKPGGRRSINKKK